MSTDTWTFDEYPYPININTSVLDNSTMASAGTFIGPIGASTGTYSINTVSDSAFETSTVKINKQGMTLQEGADIKLGNVSLKETLATIESRLNILRPNAALEAEWEELRELGQRYRQLEAELEEKSRVWKILQTEDNT
jgi:hypothetical protein